MKNDGISQSEPRKMQLDEAKVCQLMAVLAEMWPDVGGSKPDLKVVAAQREPEPLKAAMSDEAIRSQLLAHIRKTWPEEFAVDPPELEVVAIKEDPESRNLRVTIVDRKKRRDQLNALLDEAWGPVQNETPKPRVDRVKVDRLKAMIRATWPDEFGAGKKVVQFPRTTKRGAKKRSGPCADIVAFRCGRSDFSDNERAVFDTFAKTQGARYAVAVVEYFRLPLDEGSRFCRLGMTPAEFLRSLDNKRI